MYKQCLLAGLLSGGGLGLGGGVGGGVNGDGGGSLSAIISGGGGGAVPSTSAQRDALLSLILCHGLVGFLSACATGEIRERVDY